MSIFLKIIGGLLAVWGGLLARRISKFLLMKIKQSKSEFNKQAITLLVKASEQSFKDYKDSGRDKFDFVIDHAKQDPDLKDLPLQQLKNIAESVVLDLDSNLNNPKNKKKKLLNSPPRKE